MSMSHYTDKDGFEAIHSQPEWMFKAFKPPCGNPVGAYFTNLPETTRLLARKLRIPRTKLEYMFAFFDVGDLHPIRGDRGRFIFYSPTDYPVATGRQIAARKTKLADEER